MVAATEQPFVQAIFDLAVPKMVFGNVVLLGDAAFVVRPHTASGTSKAAGDALALAHTIGEGWSEAASTLGAWSSERMAIGRRLVEYGQFIAKRGGLGQ